MWMISILLFAGIWVIALSGLREVYQQFNQRDSDVAAKQKATVINFPPEGAIHRQAIFMNSKWEYEKATAI